MVASEAGDLVRPTGRSFRPLLYYPRKPIGQDEQEEILAP